MNSYFNKEFLLVKFPIIFPLIYLFILVIFPNFETYLIFFTILLLAEPHFGATWPFFINKSNKKFINSNKFNLIYIPLIIVLLSLAAFIFFQNIFYLIFFAVNMYHVARQSLGVTKLYSENKSDINFNERMIYFFNFLFFVIAYIKFFLNIDLSEYIFLLNILIIGLILSCKIIYIFLFGFNQNLFPLLTGVLIFYPVLIVNNPVHVILFGVTMHFSQYLYLTNKVVTQREIQEKKVSRKNYLSFKFITTIILYGILMTMFSLFGIFEEESILKNLIIIPILGQMLHFYLDSQLWKFSNKHVRDNVLNYILIK